MDLSCYKIVCLNNAWRLFENSQFDIWIHSGDFPRENYPKYKNYSQEISHKEYSTAIKNFCERNNIKTQFPEHWVGYTMFFQGLYWIMNEFRGTEIHLLGFDHDYNKEKTAKWLELGKPTPQNNFFRAANETIKEWSEKTFSEFKSDFFYGHGTPDPLRLGEEELINKFNQAYNLSKDLGVQIINLSNLPSKINCFNRL
jgi:hypothetical protein